MDVATSRAPSFASFALGLQLGRSAVLPAASSKSIMIKKVLIYNNLSFLEVKVNDIFLEGAVASFPMSRVLQDHQKSADSLGWILGLQHIASESPFQYLNMNIKDLEKRERTILFRAVLEVALLETLNAFGLSTRMSPSIEKRFRIF